MITYRYIEHIMIEAAVMMQIYLKNLWFWFGLYHNTTLIGASTNQ
jgi:hypothetical protein